MGTAHNITIDQGTDFLELITIKSDTVTTVDVTGYIFRGQIRTKPTAPELIAEFVFVIKDQNTNEGEVEWTLPNSALAALPIKANTIYYYDVEMKDLSNKITRILQGTVTVTPEITKDAP